MTPQFFTGPDGARLAYHDQGQGLPVLCLAGLTRTMADFDYALPALSGCRVIRMDYRGRGASDWTGAASYTVPTEAQDALALLDHLGLAKAALLGTSRGGLIGMFLALVAKDRLMGLCLNDVGPVIHTPGLDRIKHYVGRNPSARTMAEAAARLPHAMAGFDNVPPSRWAEEAGHFYVETPKGLQNTYDPSLREAFLAAFAGPEPDLWPLFDACAGLPMALIRGANSDLLSTEVAAEMRTRRPDMVFCDVPDRGHVPFLDEPAAVAVLQGWLKAMQ
ncbi:MAG: alpha/beta hydrolase [Paracoccaceae bacterium]